MIATIVNCIAVIVGSLIGVLFNRRINERFKRVVFVSVGLVALAIGIQMSFSMKQIIYVAFSLVVGGLLGDWWDIEGAILRLGELLKGLVRQQSAGKEFAEGFLSSSVLFCVGAMALVGSFQAGAQGNYTLILTKSVMDGFMAIMLAAALGIGVMFSALSLLVYQGALTLLSMLIGPYVSEMILAEVSGLGGILVMMIGLNLLELKTIKTANFLPGLVIVVILAAFDAPISRFFSTFHL